jgi:protein involved in polysaccharide export with SLBB domain
MRLLTLAIAFVLCVRCDGWQSILPVLPLGRGDIIDVVVEGEDDLTTHATISSQGDISLPLLKEHLHVEGLLPDAIEKVVADAYKHEQLLIDPRVKVSPAEYHSYLVRVTGAVDHPYDFQATEQYTLLSVLARAGGPTKDSTGDIEVIRKDRDTGKETKQVISIRALLEDNDPKYNIVMRGGEEIHLPAIVQVAK